MRTILVAEKAGLGDALKNHFEKAGFNVIHSTDKHHAIAQMSGETRIDFVVSAGRHWKSCYELALMYYGITNVVICTGDLDVKADLDSRCVMVFEKPFIFEDLVTYVLKVCPPN